LGMIGISRANLSWRFDPFPNELRLISRKVCPEQGRRGAKFAKKDN
jgi:hypothetical protein